MVIKSLIITSLYICTDWKSRYRIQKLISMHHSIHNRFSEQSLSMKGSTASCHCAVDGE